MASMKKQSRSKSYRVAYKHPIKGKRSDYFKNKKDAVMALAHWQKIELLVKMELDWESEMHQAEKPITVQEIIDLHKNNVLANKDNINNSIIFFIYHSPP